jgi:hypothetical protein
VGHQPLRLPDLQFLANENLSRLRNSYIEGPADLVIEIISLESRDRDRAPQTQYGNHDAPNAQFTIAGRDGTSIHLNSPAAETDCARGAPKIVRRMQIIQAVGIAPTQRAFHQGNLRPRSQMERF